MSRVAKEIREKFSCKVRTITYDFRNSDGYDRIASELNQLPGKIDVLVNNVGIWGEEFYRFSEIPDSPRFIRDIININVVSYAQMSAIIIPEMCARDRGIIINVNSMAAECALPLMALYAATKGFGDLMTRAMEVKFLY